jgi:hypothetical protein
MADEVVSTTIGASEGLSWDSVDFNDTSADTASVEGTEEGVEATEEIDGADESVETEAVEENDGAVEESEQAAAEETAQTEAGDADYVERERYGKKEWVFKASRGETIYNAYKVAQQAEGVIGEPLTTEAVQARQDAYIDQQSMINDFLSGDPSYEGRVLEFFAGIADQAKQNGEVGHDPMVNLASRMPEFFRKNEQAYKALAVPVLRHQIDALKQVARERVASNKDDNALALSLQWIEKALFGEHTPLEKMLAAPDQVDARLKQLEEREARLNQVESGRRQQEWQSFVKQTNEDVRSTITAAIEGALKDIAPSYEKFPEDYAAVKRSLHQDFVEQMKGNAAWQAQLSAISRRAQNATSPSAREQAKKDLISKYKANAESWADPARNSTVKNLLSRRAAQIKQESDAKHKRLATAAAKREPGSTGTPVKQSAKSLPNGLQSSADWAAFMDA